MPKYLVLPKIGMNMEEGVISEWLVKPGDRVEKEQMVVRAETDKAVQDMFATESGIVYKLLVQPGDVVPCQEKIAILLDEGEEYIEEEQEEKKEEAKKAASIDSETEQRKQFVLTAERKERQIRISPLARKMAKDLGITEEKLCPEQEGKRIVKADVLRYQEKLEAKHVRESMSTEENVFVPFSRKRQVIARRMTESFNQKPRVTMVTTVDCEQLKELRGRLKARAKVGYNEILAKVCAAALKKYPELNCVREAEGVYIKKAVNIGIAVDTEDGLIVPVLKDVQKKGILELAEEFQQLIEKARNGRLSIEEMSGGTFTVSNVGMYGVESFDPIVNPPECFILGVGCMKECPVVVNHEVCVRTCMDLSLSFDHAVFDGAAAAKLLREIKELLEEPMLLLA